MSRKFLLESSDHSIEAKSLINACLLYPTKYSYQRLSTKFIRQNDSDVPVTSIQKFWDYLSCPVIPEHYPQFMQGYLHRKVWYQDKWEFSQKTFVKPFDRPKRFNPVIAVPGSYKGKKKPPYWCSEIVDFEDEWRLYVINGKIVYN